MHHLSAPNTCRRPDRREGRRSFTEFLRALLPGAKGTATTGSAPATALAPTPQRPPTAPPTPAEVTAARTSIAAAVEQHRLVDAIRLATAHVDGMAARFGTAHAHTIEALEVLAHLNVLTGDEHRALVFYVHAADRRARCTSLPAADPVPGLVARARTALQAPVGRPRRQHAATAAR
ncbi:hypothetical protein [Kitasatospora sp. NPDC088548]|uniref:hypothetical protein n=1 Tax=Kitasatospora sp. NPDC088548 TaxID=3364075 RepID=UPI003805E7C6